MHTVNHTVNGDGSAHRHSILRRALQLIFLGVLLTFAVGATDANVRFNSLGHEMMCQCGCNQVLLECNHVGCTVSEKMRAELTAAMNGGGSDDQILKQFVDKYGSVVLAAPTTTGFNRVAWIMPYLALVVGFGLCVFFVRAWKNRRPALAAPAVSMPMDASGLDEYRKRVHQETEI
jgi:cytochrome c-type biogenesis protein CcmH